MLLALLTAAACVFVARRFVGALGAPDADEVGHALEAAALARPLAAGDVGEFVARTRLQVFWPFLHRWYLAAAFLVAGISTETARLACLAAFGATILAAYALAQGLREAEGEKTPAPLFGLLSAALLMTTPDLWSKSIRVMMESLGMFAGTAALAALAFAVARRSRGLALLAGLLGAAAFLTKYNYGLPLIPALVVAAAFVPREDGRRLGLAREVALGAGLPLALWFLDRPVMKLDALREFAQNRDEGLSFFANLFFYPLELCLLYTSPSPRD